jgi:DNA-binding GntR family transcriptional regulator
MAASSNNFHPIDSASLREQIEQQVRSAILNGSFGPGEHLVETTIAEQLGVSRAPVREALSALEREGVILYVPRKGYFVVDFTAKDIEEIYILRLMLEIGALRRSIHRSSDSAIAKLQQFVDDLGEAVREGKGQNEVATLDLAFHELICQQADHSRLYSAWNSMRLQTWLLIGLTSKTEYDHPDQPKEFHQSILDAILDEDLEKAEALLRSHILDAQERALAAMQAERQGTN